MLLMYNICLKCSWTFVFRSEPGFDSFSGRVIIGWLLLSLLEAAKQLTILVCMLLYSLTNVGLVSV